jgi:glucose-6-phosphate isomerase
MGNKARGPETLPAWQLLSAHYATMREFHMRDLFAEEANRVASMSCEIDGLLLDYSRNIANPETIRLIGELIEQCGFQEHRERMLQGQHVNNTEDRAVLHVALRADREQRFRDGDQDCTHDVHQVLDDIESFVSRTTGDGRGRFRHIVNIGIGGSDLGIAMACQALRPYWMPGVEPHFVSNIDGTQLADLRGAIDPAETLFVVCSKSFTTQETMVNAQAAREWVTSELGSDSVADHFVAVSTNHKAMDSFGIRPDHRFAFWDWVGGRFSLWSAVGLTVALTIGMENFRRLLAGGRAMDQHFMSAPPARNLPAILAGLSVWYSNFFGAGCQAVLPYDNRLHRFPAFLQQLQMESNGKRVRRDGQVVDVASGPIVFGEPGSNAQHSFYQLLHQGTHMVPVDFIATVNGSGASVEQQDLALTNCLAQAQALMTGQAEEVVRAELESAGMAPDDVSRLAPHKVHPGNRPSNTILLPRLDPEALGSLVALYEHKVFIEGVIWGINSFDQWGVELGKKLARRLADRSETDDSVADSSTAALLAKIGAWRA